MFYTIISTTTWLNFFGAEKKNLIGKISLYRSDYIDKLLTEGKNKMNKKYDIMKDVLKSKYGCLMTGINKKKARIILFKLMESKGKFC